MTAHMYPIKEELNDAPYAERIVYEALEGLNSNYYIFHSVQWMKKTKTWPTTWKENDFLILHRNLGALVLEVKGGDIQYTGTVFNQINSETGEVSVLDPKKKKDPLSQAIDGIYHYRDLLEKLHRATNTRKALDDRFPVEAAVWFPGCYIGEKIKTFPLKYREVKEAVLDHSNLSNVADSLHQIFDFYDTHNKVDITDEEFQEILELIAQDFDLISAPAVKKEELDKAFLKLTKEQAGLLDYIEEQKYATIQGVAGTGKTLVAKEAALKFSAQGRKVLFLCFNRFLFAHLQRMYPAKNVDYYNIHSFISHYGSNEEDLSDPEKRAQALLEIDWDKLNYDDVIIDEAQDFVNDEIIYFKEYVELQEGHFIAFFDKNQLLTTKEVPEWITSSECKLLLTKNCRNTYEIAHTAYNIIDVELNQKVMMLHSDEKTGLCFSKGNPISPIGKLIRALMDEKHGYAPSDIVILTLKSESKSILSDITKINGVPISREKTNSSILFTSASKFKGLESCAVIIVDIDETFFSDESKRRNFYVACSRATHSLTLFISGDDDKIKEIADAINYSGHFAAKGVIAMKTQSRILDLNTL